MVYPEEVISDKDTFHPNFTWSLSISRIRVASSTAITCEDGQTERVNQKVETYSF